jgi:hypothetical protein
MTDFSKKVTLLIIFPVLGGMFRCGGGEPDCSGVHVVSVQTADEGPTTTCGPEAVISDVSLTNDGTLVTVRYRRQLMVCGGDIGVDLVRQSGGQYLFEEVVEGGGVCGCYSNILMTVQIDVCLPGSYTFVVAGEEHTATI